MFHNLAQAFTSIGQPAETIFTIHPEQLSRWLEEAFQNGGAGVPPLAGQPAGPPFLGNATITASLGLPTQTPPNFINPSGITPLTPTAWTPTLGPPVPGTPVVWDHLMYAYLVESTGVFEVFREVIRRFVSGESFGQMSPQTMQWMFATEQLFFRDPPLFSAFGVVSDVRPNATINRRNLYYRVLGFDLPHSAKTAEEANGTEPWKAGAGSATNNDFRAKWSELLRQAWLGLKNRSNEAGANPTDPAYVALICESLQHMMNNRRRGGQLAREEFAYVSALSWFDLTLAADTPVIADLKAQATFADERLAAVGSRVGMTPSARTRELIQLARPASALLRGIERGLFSQPGQAAALFTGNTPLTNDVNNIINLWQSATGDRVKDATVATAGPIETQPLRIPKPSAPAATVGSNGSGG